MSHSNLCLSSDYWSLWGWFGGTTSILWQHCLTAVRDLGEHTILATNTMPSTIRTAKEKVNSTTARPCVEFQMVSQSKTQTSPEEMQGHCNCKINGLLVLSCMQQQGAVPQQIMHELLNSCDTAQAFNWPCLPLLVEYFWQRRAYEYLTATGLTLGHSFATPEVNLLWPSLHRIAV